MAETLPIWLIRHGQSAANAGLVTEHPQTIALTALGVAQAEGIAQKMTQAPDWIVVSPFQRTADTAAPSLKRYPQLTVHTWPIQELTYLSPVRCRGTTVLDRQGWAQAYWQAGDPHAVDGEGAESYGQFMARVRSFSVRLKATPGFGAIFGHGMFLKAFLIALEHGFEATTESMARFRALESAAPLVNGQILIFDRQRLGRLT